jgi:hypothetical protein
VAVAIEGARTMSLASAVLSLLNYLPENLRHSAIRSTLRFSDTEIAGVRVKLAETPREALAAARVVHDAYAGRGISNAHPSGIRIAPHALLPSTQTFIAIVDGKVVGTMSLIGDSPLGLPIERIYRPEVAAMRKQGSTIAEVGALAILPGFRKRGIVCLLNRLMFEVARDMGVDKLVAAVHPIVQEIYRASLLFTLFGEEKIYPGLNSQARAVGLVLDVQGAKERYRKAFGHLPRTNSNPYFLYVESKRPEIVSPPRGDLSKHGDRRGISRALLRARPDVMNELTPAALEYLHALLHESDSARHPTLTKLREFLTETAKFRLGSIKPRI